MRPYVLTNVMLNIQIQESNDLLKPISRSDRFNFSL